MSTVPGEAGTAN